MLYLLIQITISDYGLVDIPRFGVRAKYSYINYIPDTQTVLHRL